jgi:hypothetical protein
MFCGRSDAQGLAINSLLFAATAVGFARLLASARRPGTLLQMGE